MIWISLILLAFALAIAGAGVLIGRVLTSEQAAAKEPPGDISDMFVPSDGALTGDAAAKGGPWAGTGDVDRTIL